jgi:TolB-like protein
MSLAPGSRLGVYEVIAPIGAGGMGEVYRARDSKLRRDVALKVLPAAFASDPDRLARFEREAYAVAALSHPNILAIHDFGRDNGISYAVMELLEGHTLREALANGALPRRKALDYGRQIAQALAAAHARGIVHRDLKPENVFVTTGGHVKVLDFGLASTAATPQDVDATQAVTVTGTQAGTVLGTPGYMSPEQVRGETVDHRSDIFSFGCVLYEMVSGLRAFAGESSIDTLHATLRAEPRDLASLSDAPVALTRVVERCLEKNPAERMQSTRDLVFTLNTITAEDAAGGLTPGRSQHSEVPAGTAAPVAHATGSYVRPALIAFGLIAALAGGWFAFRGRPTTPGPAAASASAPRGVAVVPFENRAGPDQAYFAAGVTEEVTLQIAKMSALRVMSRAAVARFKDPISELAAMTRELGIKAVLTGSVRHADGRVRVGVQLLAAPSGETLWSEQYDGDIKNVLDVQSTVALRVARALQASLAPGERARIERLPTGNAEAYDVYLKSLRGL